MTARRAITTAALAVLAPSCSARPPKRSCAGAAAPRRPGVRCAKLRVPLDRSGALPGNVDLRVARVRLSEQAPAAVPHVPLRRAGRRRRRRDDRRAAHDPQAHARLHRARLRSTRHRAQRPAALPGDRGRRAPALHPRGGAVRAPARRPALVLHDAGQRGGHGGAAPGRRRAQAHAVRHLLRHRARARLRPRLSGTGRAARSWTRSSIRTRPIRSGSPASGRWGRRCARSARSAAAA